MTSEISIHEMTVEKLLTIVESISDGVMAVNNDLQVIYFNKSAEVITGKKSSEVIGNDCNVVMDVCDTDCAMVETMRTGQKIINQYVCITHSNGSEVPISVSTALLRDKSGEIVGGVETFRDLSQVEVLRKELEHSYTFGDMIGHSKMMRELFDLLPTIARSHSTVLIEGASGTGKELVARAIHQFSTRSDKPMICVNCGAIPNALLESELFGYKAGAFTDAQKDKKGRFALADGGTLFLDEIGDISPELQVKLLRVLQEHVYEPLGSTKSEKADVRIITATNRDLVALMKVGKFRQDLYYRINVIGIKVAPLSERMEDIPLLIDHFIGKYNVITNTDISGITPDALKILMNHDFPGNVRELENIIERAFVLCPGGVIKAEHLPGYLGKNSRPIPVVEVSGSLEQMEILTITAALKRNNMNRKRTARELGINPSTLYRKMQKYDLTDMTCK
ncbi:MAG: sigma 54-interacting transcriptional regulator [Candidatus Electryoneaceae bacterium]|nr:sigma 54-interacting transcriptional regulator [Candidatus Electryoneaceae bacterium]